LSGLKEQILIVEDEESLLHTLSLNFKLENYDVLEASTGGQALEIFKKNYLNIDLAILDVMLPETNGFELCRQFKILSPDTPVIFLTAKNMSRDKISGLKLGADDYLVKPFDLEELLLRVKNVIRRKPRPDPLYKIGSCAVNFETFEATDITGKKISLSKREAGLLKILVSYPGKVISREEIISSLWQPEDNASSRTIDNYILAFRKYFELHPKEPEHFFSIRGVGYKFSAGK